MRAGRMRGREDEQAGGGSGWGTSMPPHLTAPHLTPPLACCMMPVVMQELLADRTKLQAEVEALRAAAAAEASSNKAELSATRTALEQQRLALEARAEAVSEGAVHQKSVMVSHVVMTNDTLGYSICCCWLEADAPCDAPESPATFGSSTPFLTAMHLC